MTALKVKGMTCEHCSKAVQEALQSVAGSEKVSVDLSSGIAKVEGQAKLEQLIAAVEAEGYSATALG